MNPFLFTITFLSLIGILTSSEVVKYTQTSLGHHYYQGHLAATEEKEHLIQAAYFEDYRKQPSENPKPREPSPPKKEAPPPPKRSPALNINTQRPPNNARLNFALLFNAPSKGFHYETAAKLLRLLYQDLPEFSAIPNAEYALLDALLAEKEEAKNFTYPDELAAIDLRSKELQNLFVILLKGHDHFPSLLNYITFDMQGSNYQQKINFMFASSELLSAVAPKISVATKLIELQKKSWDEIDTLIDTSSDFEEQRGRRELKKELKDAFDEIMRQEDLGKNFKNIFDFTLGKPGTVLFIKDPATGLILREKYLKPIRSR